MNSWQKHIFLSPYVKRLIRYCLLLVCLFYFASASAQNTLSGTITLPLGEVANTPIDFQVEITEFTGLGEIEQSSSSFVTIFDGNQISYSVDFPQPLDVNEVSVRFSCGSNCENVDGGLSRSFYVQDDGSIKDIFNSMPLTAIPAIVDFQYPSLPERITLSGNVILPDGANLDDGDGLGLEMEIVIREVSSSGSFLRSERVEITVPEGSPSQAYSLEYFAPLSTSRVSIAFFCNSICAGIDENLSRLFFLQDDGSSATNSNTFGSGELPLVADLEFPGFPPIVTLSGTIELPEGVVSEGNTSVRVELEENNQNGFFIRQSAKFIDLPNSTSEVTYNLEYFLPELDSELTLSFNCNLECINVDGGQQTRFYLQDDGSFGEELNSIAVSQLPEVLDFQFPDAPELRTLSGTISLPDGIVSQGNRVEITLIENFVDASSPFRIQRFSDSIPSNESELEYTIQYVAPEVGNEVSVEFRCSFNCENIFLDSFDSFYLQDDGGISFGFNRVDALAVPTNLDFEFPTPSTLSGVIRLPESATSSATVEVLLTTVNTEGISIDSSSLSVSVPAGQNGAAYLLNYVPPTGINQLRVTFRCTSIIACTEVDNGQSLDYILQDDGSFSLSENTLDPVQTPELLDFQFPGLPVASNISGTISLPTGIVSIGEITFEVTLEERFSTGRTVTREIAFVNIPSGLQQTTYSLDYFAFDENSEFIISFQCIDNFDICFEANADRSALLFYQDDGSFSVSPNSVDIGDIPETLDFSFPDVSLTDISGTIQLPNGVVSDGAISVRLRLTEIGFGSREFVATIPAGANSIEYSLEYPIPADDSFIELSFSCLAICNQVVFNPRLSFLLQEDGTFSLFGSIPSAAVPEILDFQFPELPANRDLTGIVSLPEGIVSDGSIQIIVNTQGVNEDGFQLRRSFQANVPAGESELLYNINYFVAPIFNDVRVSFACSNNCLEINNPSFNSFFLQDDGSVNQNFNAVDVASVPDSLDFQFPGRPLLNGTLRLPDGVVSDGSTELRVRLVELDAVGNFIRFIGVDEVLPSGTAEIGYSIRYNEPASGNLLSVEISCIADCDGIAGNPFIRFYLQDDGSVTDVFNSVTFASVPDEVDFQFPRVPIQPDSFEVDDVTEQANNLMPEQQQIHSIHDEGDEDWLSFTLEQASDIALISIVTQNDISILELELFDEDLNSVATDLDDLSELEAEDSRARSIDINQLAAGTYFLRVRAASPIGLVDSYTLELIGPELEDETFCFPIAASNGRLAVICL